MAELGPERPELRAEQPVDRVPLLRAERDRRAEQPADLDCLGVVVAVQVRDQELPDVGQAGTDAASERSS